MHNLTLFLAACLLAIVPANGSVGDQGELSLAGRRERRTKTFSDGRSIVAYEQSGTIAGEGPGGPWRKTTLFVQGSEFKGAHGDIIADVALWETTDAGGDVVWGVLFALPGRPKSVQLKAGTGKWKGIAGSVSLPEGGKRWEMSWRITNPGSAAPGGNPSDYSHHDTGLSFHGPHITEQSRTLPNGVILEYSSQSGVLLSDSREAVSPRNLATCYDRGTTYRLGGRSLGDVMLLEDTGPEGDTVWLYHEWWYGEGTGSYEFIGGTGKWKGISGYGKTLGILRERVDDHYMLKSEVHWNIK